MIYYNFNGYEGFKEIFGINEHGNGVKSRNNKILLGFLKNRELLHQAVQNNDFSLLHISNMVDLKNILTKRIRVSGIRSGKNCYRVDLMGKVFASDTYSTDESRGLCEDGTPNAIRYINHKLDKVFKMKCGKFYKSIILASKFGKTLPESIVIYLCEEFTMEWQCYTMSKLPKNKLFVNDKFSDIYSSGKCDGNFCSCMVDRELDSFYSDSVEAKAAYLQNDLGMIIARCIVFTKVMDETGRVWRYAERQYSTDGNDILKRALIDALIQAGEIDCYKKVGAACSDPTSILDIHGNSLATKKFSIECDLDDDDALSYQDTFKWYDMNNNIAYNYQKGHYNLDTTDGSISGSGEDQYDEFHENYCAETTNVHFHGVEMACDVDELDEFSYFDYGYYHDDDLVKCPECGCQMLNPEYYENSDDVFHSEITDDYYCCECCQDNAEEYYKDEHWFYSEYDGEYFREESDVVKYHVFNAETGKYDDSTISVGTLEKLLGKGEMHIFSGMYYDEINEETGRPYNLENVLEFV